MTIFCQRWFKSACCISLAFSASLYFLLGKNVIQTTCADDEPIFYMYKNKNRCKQSLSTYRRSSKVNVKS